MPGLRQKDEPRKALPEKPPAGKFSLRKVHFLRICLVSIPKDEKAFQTFVRTVVKRHGGLIVRKEDKDLLGLFESASGALQAGLRIDVEVRRLKRKTPDLEVQLSVQTDSHLTAEERAMKPMAPREAPAHLPDKKGFEHEVSGPNPLVAHAPGRSFPVGVDSGGTQLSAEDLREFTLQVFSEFPEETPREALRRVLPVKEILLGSLVLLMVAVSLMLPLRKPSGSWLSHLSFGGGSPVPAPALSAPLNLPPVPAAAPVKAGKPAPPNQAVRPAEFFILAGGELGRWELLNADGTSAQKSLVSGSRGKALRLDYDFGGGDWVQVKRDLSPGRILKGLKGSWKAEGSRNRLQIELVDEDGSTFVYGWTPDPSGKWASAEIPVRKFSYQGGGDSKLGRVVQVYFTVSKQEGGTGTVLLEGWSATGN